MKRLALPAFEYAKHPPRPPTYLHPIQRMALTDAATIAYYTVVDDGRTGWTGGLLVLTSGGRPIEFQCTLPVRPSRAHEILFGPTLRDHLIGDVIGSLLVKKVRTPISLLCCDQPEALKIEAAAVGFPVALVVEAAESEEGPISDETIVGFTSLPLIGSTLRVAMEKAEAVHAIISKLSDLPDAIEPFDRIREAIKEAQSQIARAQTARAA